jgi:hypothetical protein
MSKPATSLVITRAPIVDDKGTATRDLLKWFQDIDKKTNASLTVLGIDPNAVIGGNAGTIGSQLQHVDANGMLQPAGVGFTLSNVPGTIASGQVGFTLDAVSDGASRFAVAQVDSAHLPIINFSDAAHQNKILDNINDGTTYQRFTRVTAGQAALTPGVITAGTATTSTIAITGVLATDTIIWCFSGVPAAGYAASASGSLFVLAYATAGNVNFYVGNSNATTPITAAAQNVNYEVLR